MLVARLKPPGNLSHLQRLIAEIASVAGEVKRIQRAIANTIVGQMPPPGVVKGGTAMKLRLGEAHSRFTPDLDAARKAGLAEDDYMEAFALRLREGWAGFTGTVEADTKPAPPDVPDDYIMSPYWIRLAYRGREWLRVRFELGRDEVGSTVVAEPRMAGDVAAMLQRSACRRPSRSRSCRLPTRLPRSSTPARRSTRRPARTSAHTTWWTCNCCPGMGSICRQPS
jgi:hypothetical protein